MRGFDPRIHDENPRRKSYCFGLLHGLMGVKPGMTVLNLLRKSQRPSHCPFAPAMFKVAAFLRA
jgi:hypothetical protein